MREHPASPVVVTVLTTVTAKETRKVIPVSLPHRNLCKLRALRLRSRKPLLNKDSRSKSGANWPTSTVKITNSYVRISSGGLLKIPASAAGVPALARDHSDHRGRVSGSPCTFVSLASPPAASSPAAAFAPG